MSHPDPLYDDYNDFYDGVDADDRTNDYWAGDDDLNNDDRDYDDENSGEIDWNDSYDDSMDGDAESALSSAGWGTDEDYGYYGDVDSEDFHSDEAIGFVEYNEDEPYYD